MARRFNVQGTNDFLIGAVVLLVFGLLCVKDGWFPSEAVLVKHPHEIQIAAEKDGTVMDVFVKRGELIRAEQPIVRLALSATQGEEIVKGLPREGVENFSVNDVRVSKGDLVKRAQVVAVLVPAETFYVFNHTCAILALLGALICAIIHFLVR
jgi:multidrug resistance efflux pump